jgi:hypothetical protein
MPRTINRFEAVATIGIDTRAATGHAAAPPRSAMN